MILGDHASTDTIPTMPATTDRQHYDGTASGKLPLMSHQNLGSG